MTRYSATIFLLLAISPFVGCGSSSSSPSSSSSSSSSSASSSSSIDTNLVPATFLEAHQQEIDIKKELTKILDGIQNTGDAESANSEISRLAKGLKNARDGMQKAIDSGQETPDQMKEGAKSLSGKANHATAKMNDAWSKLKKNTAITGALEPSMKEFRSAASSMSNLRRTITNPLPGFKK